MINLLPAEDKILIKKEYRRRLFIVIGVSIFIFICVAIILFSPSYFLLVSQKKILENRLAVLLLGFEMKKVTEIEELTRDLNDKLISLSTYKKNFFSVSVLIGQILENKSSAVKLNRFFYQENKEQKRFFLEGLSSTRSAFLALVKNLEDMDDVAKVISPPSNILKEENIAFNLIIELR